MKIQTISFANAPGHYMHLDDRSKQSCPASNTSTNSSPHTYNQGNRDEMVTQGIPSSMIQTLSRINKFNPLLCNLGILPNQLRHLMNSANLESDEIFKELSITLFHLGYNVWKTRVKLNKNFWLNIAQEEWKPKKNTKRRNREQIQQITCQNPFHFLPLHSNFSKERPTPCKCSHIIKKPQKINS